jgi:hypothetical protein
MARGLGQSLELESARETIRDQEEALKHHAFLVKEARADRLQDISGTGH